MSKNENLPPLPGGYSTMSGTTAYTAQQMREYAELAALGSWQQGWNECSDLREKQIAKAEVDALKYRALLASATGKPENLRRLLSDEAYGHYVTQQDIEAVKPSPAVQIAAHVMVSERHGKFDLIHLVAYLLDRSPWRTIASAPKGHSILLWTDHGPVIGWWSVPDNQWTAGLWSVLFPTHWMPIPPLPEVKP